MIRYALACDAGHRFESWFRDSEAFVTQSEQQLVSCPTCGSSRVAKTIMSPTVVARGHFMQGGDRERQEGSADSLLGAREREVREVARALRARLFAETQDVGARFAEAARRIHDGDEPHRAIRGQATATEARSLLEDGIVVLPFPSLPEDLD